MSAGTRFASMIFGAALVLMGDAASASAGDISLPDARAFPESVAVTADGVVLASSFALGTIYRAAPGASAAAPWILPAASGLSSASGLFPDEQGHRLLACGETTAAMPILAAFDLATGAPLATYPLPAGGHCNDVTIGPGGAVFVTDTARGRILRLNDHTLTVWAAGPELTGADGIVVAPAGGAFIISTLTDKLISVAIKPDGSAGAASELTPSRALAGPDGLHKGPDNTLFLAETAGGRIDELTVSGARVNVVTLQDGFQNPTAAVAAHGSVYVVESKLPLRVAANLAKNAGPFVISVVQLPATH